MRILGFLCLQGTVRPVLETRWHEESIKDCFYALNSSAMIEYIVCFFAVWIVSYLFTKCLEIDVQKVFWTRNPRYERLAQQYENLQRDYDLLDCQLTEIDGVLRAKINYALANPFQPRATQVEVQEALALAYAQLDLYRKETRTRAMAPIQ